jgi:starch synthase
VSIVYEPLGIVNLEAMACELAVVATATGGIPRSSSTARPDGWCRSSRWRRQRVTVDPDRFVSTLPGR